MAKTSTINPISDTTAYTYAFTWLTINSDTTGSISKGGTADISFSYNTNYGLQSRAKTIKVTANNEDSGKATNNSITVTQSAASAFANIETISINGTVKTISDNTITIDNTGSDTTLSVLLKTNDFSTYFGTTATNPFKIYLNGDETYSFIDSSYGSCAYNSYDAMNSTAYFGSSYAMSNNSGFSKLPPADYTAYIYGYMHVDITLPANTGGENIIYKLSVLGTTYTVTLSKVSGADITISGPTGNLSAAGGEFSATISSNFDTDYSITISD